MQFLIKGEESEEVTQLKPLDFISVEYDENSNCVISFKGLEIPAESTLLILFTIKKHMMGFEEYPNDPSRGFNIPHMPLYYIIQGQPA
mmetsp:Transcript_20150/g.19116  ORF Transcript_20150/g.19116 Transcript_20150/m.19116 type:complete len:88 (-) Transcript_20150:182-445(-)